MLRFRPKVSYYWFPTHVEAHTAYKYSFDGDNVTEVPGRSLIKYQIVKTAQDCDFTKYHCGMFENDYPFRV